MQEAEGKISTDPEEYEKDANDVYILPEARDLHIQRLQPDVSLRLANRVRVCTPSSEGYC